MSITTRAEDLKNFFSKLGEVVGAKVVNTVRQTGGHQYFGYVTMKTPEQATRFINKLHRTKLRNRYISVVQAGRDVNTKKPNAKPATTSPTADKEKENTSGHGKRITDYFASSGLHTNEFNLKRPLETSTTQSGQTPSTSTTSKSARASISLMHDGKSSLDNRPRNRKPAVPDVKNYVSRQRMRQREVDAIEAARKLDIGKTIKN